MERSDVESKITLDAITKRFAGIVANDAISIDVAPGEIHALVGENGAGKSTLMNILYGLIQPDEGRILVDGRPVRFRSSRDSIACRIGMVHQHFMLVPKLTVAENIIVGREPGSPLKVDRKEAERRIADLADRYRLRIDPSVKVGTLTVSEQQRVEILKLLYREAEILIFDEPTAVLAPQEIDEFCEILLGLKAMGKTIIFISHKLAEVMKTADRITVIRLGKVMGTVAASDTSPEALTFMMVGRDVDLSGSARRDGPGRGETVLEVRDVSLVLDRTVKKLSGVSLSLRKGEILGVAGVDGNGQEELVRVISGQMRPDSGTILYRGIDITATGIKARKKGGMALIPEDRHRDGLVLGYSVEENLILGRHRDAVFCKSGFWMDFRAIRGNAEEMKKRFDIRCASVSMAASVLSGGNQQKIVIAREITSAPDVVLAVQPTRGLDVGAMEFVRNSLVEQRNQGKGVLLFSLELDEILALSDRIAVMYRGRIVAVADAKKVGRQELGLMMLGSGGSGGPGGPGGGGSD